MKTYDDLMAWEKAVKEAYPEHSARIKFKGRIEKSISTINAEIPGIDRSFGVWHVNDGEGVVLEATTIKLEAKSRLLEANDAEYVFQFRIKDGTNIGFFKKKIYAKNPDQAWVKLFKEAKPGGILADTISITLETKI